MYKYFYKKKFSISIMIKLWINTDYSKVVKHK